MKKPNVKKPTREIETNPVEYIEVLRREGSHLTTKGLTDLSPTSLTTGDIENLQLYLSAFIQGDKTLCDAVLPSGMTVTKDKETTSDRIVQVVGALEDIKGTCQPFSCQAKFRVLKDIRGVYREALPVTFGVRVIDTANRIIVSDIGVVYRWYERGESIRETWAQDVPTALLGRYD